MSEIDPISVSVFEAKLNYVAKEMSIIMLRTSRSPIFSQSHDFSCFVTDREGYLISQADGVPIHTGGGGFAVRALLKEWGHNISPMDVFVLNDPYVAGGNHLPDITIIHPVFDASDDLIAFACNRAHQVDIGGGVAGTYNPTATEIFHEGIRIPPVKLFDRGVIRQDVMNMITLNTRLPEVVEADMNSMIGSTKIGAQKIAETCGEFGTENFLSFCYAVLDHAEKVVRHQITELPDGNFTGSDFMSSDGFVDGEIEVKATVTISGSEVTVNFAGSSPQVNSYKNSSLANTYSAVYVAISTLLSGDIAHNEGSYRMVEVIAPEGSVVNPIAPAPVTFSTVHPTYEIIQAIWRALESCVPDRISAGWGKLCHPVTSGRRNNGELFIMYHMAAQPGSGAVDGRDGINQIGQLQSLGAITIPNLEIYEKIYPISFVRHQFRTDNGGPGEFRGGTGVEYEINMQVSTSNNMRGEGLNAQTGFGVCGGEPGGEGMVAMELHDGSFQDTPVFGVALLDPGTMKVYSSGGGGWGNPYARTPEAVRLDVRNGLVSRECAEKEYRVAITEEDQVDESRTTALRACA